MKFFVDEMPLFNDECPFSQHVCFEIDGKWRDYCSLCDSPCDLHEKAGECFGLKAIKIQDLKDNYKEENIGDNSVKFERTVTIDGDIVRYGEWKIVSDR